MVSRVKPQETILSPSAGINLVTYHFVAIPDDFSISQLMSKINSLVPKSMEKFLS